MNSYASFLNIGAAELIFQGTIVDDSKDRSDFLWYAFRYSINPSLGHHARIRRSSLVLRGVYSTGDC